MNDSIPYSIKPITWEEFQRRKEKVPREVLRRAGYRIKQGSPSHYNLDLDLLPILSLWDAIPFSFTLESCSGTPREHQREHYSPVNGREGNPHAYLSAHSYIAHRGFGKLMRFLDEYLADKADLSRSGPHNGEGYGGIYLHMIRLWVPEGIIASNNQEYLESLWRDFEVELKKFVDEENRCDWR